MRADARGLPTTIVPYPGPADDPGFQDIFICLRPETNGMLVESIMLKVLKSAEKYSSAMQLIYMANFPGEFIIENNIVEQYYALKLHFSVMGKEAFTPEMIKAFNAHFHRRFENCEVIGSFHALKKFGMNPEQLFNLWVRKEAVCTINGQTIKRIHNTYIINYDMPALIHKNNQGTDIAVMIFRTKLNCLDLQELFRSMHKALIDAAIINPRYDMSRAFHYSKGPFEQLMDGIAYLHSQNREEIGLEDLTFVRYLMGQGIDPTSICGFLMNPTVGIKLENGRIQEVNLFQHSSGMPYDKTCMVLKQVVYQAVMIHHGPLLQSICPCLAR